MAVSDAEIRSFHASIWKVGFGSVSADEAIFLRDVVDQANAEVVLELGTATGLSGCFLIKFLDGRAGAYFRTVDTAQQFWNDKSKLTGYLIDDHIRSTNVDFAVMRGMSSIDTAKVLGGRKADVIFIDANHQHPWPLIDTLLNLNHLAPTGIMVHHDLDLFRKQQVVRGIGPKYLFDQLPDALKVVSPQATNIYAFRHPGDINAFADLISDAFLLPWSNVQPLDPAFVGHCQSYFAATYPGTKVVEKLNMGLSRFGQPAAA